MKKIFNLSYQLYKVTCTWIVFKSTRVFWYPIFKIRWKKPSHVLKTNIKSKILFVVYLNIMQYNLIHHVPYKCFKNKLLCVTYKSNLPLFSHSLPNGVFKLCFFIWNPQQTYNNLNFYTNSKYVFLTRAA